MASTRGSARIDRFGSEAVGYCGFRTTVGYWELRSTVRHGTCSARWSAFRSCLRPEPSS